MTAAQRIRVQLGNDVTGWHSPPAISDYALSFDLQTAADAFAFTFPTTREAYFASELDNEVRVFLDERRVFTGLIDDRGRAGETETGSVITIRGRDMMGRFVDESAPLIKYGGLGLVDLARKLIEGSVFTSVVTSNVTNRALRGGAVPRGSTEPPIFTGRSAPKKVEPGEKIWQVLAHFLEETGYLALASADGRSLVLCKPNHNQPVAHVLIYAPPGTSRARQSNLIRFDEDDSIGEMYSVITAMSHPPGSTPGDDSVPRKGIARDNPATADGTGARFRVRKRLILQDDSVSNPTQRAERELRERAATINKRTVTVRGHGVTTATGAIVYYTPDTIVRLEDDEVGKASDWYVSAVSYRGNKRGGQTSTLVLVPRGTDLRMSGA